MLTHNVSGILYFFALLVAIKCTISCTYKIAINSQYSSSAGFIVFIDNSET